MPSYFQTVNPWIQASGVANEGTAALANLGMALAQMRYARQRDEQARQERAQQFGFEVQQARMGQQERQQEFGLRQREAEAGEQYRTKELGLRTKEYDDAAALRAAELRNLQQQLDMRTKMAALGQSLADSTRTPLAAANPQFGSYSNAGAPMTDLRQQSAWGPPTQEGALLQVLAQDPAALASHLAQKRQVTGIPPWYNVVGPTGNIVQAATGVPPAIAGDAASILRSNPGSMMSDDTQSQLLQILMDAARRGTNAPPGVPQNGARIGRFVVQQVQ